MAHFSIKLYKTTQLLTQMLQTEASWETNQA